MIGFFSRALLGLAGLLLLVIGMSLLINPVAFAAAIGVELPDVPSVLSEYRAPGGMLLISGLFILTSAVRSQLMRPALMLGALVYGSYGASRLVGVMLDGMPSAALTEAMVVELLVGFMCLIALFGLKRKSAEAESVKTTPLSVKRGL